MLRSSSPEEMELFFLPLGLFPSTCPSRSGCDSPLSFESFLFFVHLATYLHPCRFFPYFSPAISALHKRKSLPLFFPFLPFLSPLSLLLSFSEVIIDFFGDYICLLSFPPPFFFFFDHFAKSNLFFWRISKQKTFSLPPPLSLLG